MILLSSIIKKIDKNKTISYSTINQLKSINYPNCLSAHITTTMRNINSFLNTLNSMTDRMNLPRILKYSQEDSDSTIRIMLNVRKVRIKGKKSIFSRIQIILRWSVGILFVRKKRKLLRYMRKIRIDILKN